MKVTETFERNPMWRSHNPHFLWSGADVDPDSLCRQEPRPSVTQSKMMQCDDSVMMMLARVATCCSSRGWCSSSPEDCLCDDCLYYEWEEGESGAECDDVTHDQNTISAQKLLPEQLPLEDDNSDFTLQGYQNFLIEPLVKFLFYTLRTTSNVILRSDVMTETCWLSSTQLSTISDTGEANNNCWCNHSNDLWFRQMIRMTWGNDKYLRQINATLLFVVGRFPNLKIQWRLEQEGKK